MAKNVDSSKNFQSRDGDTYSPRTIENKYNSYKGPVKDIKNRPSIDYKNTELNYQNAMKPTLNNDQEFVMSNNISSMDRLGNRNDPNLSFMANDDSMSMEGFNSFIPNDSYNYGYNYGYNYSNQMQYKFNAVENTPQLDFAKYGQELIRYLRTHDYRAFEIIKNSIVTGVHDDDDEYGRTTPLLYNDPHSVGKLDFPGLFYYVIPSAVNNEGAVFHATKDFLSFCIELQMDYYPGPLDLGKSLDDEVISYLKDQMFTEIQDTNPVDWESGQLLINYLELLIKENGKPSTRSIVKLLNEGVETRTAELQKDTRLLQYHYGQQQQHQLISNSGAYDPNFSHTSLSRASSRATSRMSSRPPSPTQSVTGAFGTNDTEDDNLDVGSESGLEIIQKEQGPGSVASLITKAVSRTNQDRKTCTNLDKFRGYIFMGRFEEAVKMAVHLELWGHAFTLAHRLNNQDIVNDVIKRFTRKAILTNDPLYTMHELMSSKMPKVVALTQVFSSAEMNLWRSHLSMMLSVEKYKPEESRNAIEALGDKLILSCRDYYAGHLCYILAGTKFGLSSSGSGNSGTGQISNNRHQQRRRLELIGWHAANQNMGGTDHTRIRRGTASNANVPGDQEWWRNANERFIKLTEIYEYGLRLSKENEEKANYLSYHLAPYKYAMIYKMMLRHKVRSAYNYCREIARILTLSETQKSLFKSNFRISFEMIKNVRQLAHRLVFEMSQDDSDEENYDQFDRSDSASWIDVLDNIYAEWCYRLNFYTPKTSFDLATTLLNKQKEPDSRKNQQEQQQQQQLQREQQSQERVQYQLGSSGFGSTYTGQNANLVGDYRDDDEEESTSPSFMTRSIQQQNIRGRTNQQQQQQQQQRPLHMEQQQQQRQLHMDQQQQQRPLHMEQQQQQRPLHMEQQQQQQRPLHMEQQQQQRPLHMEQQQQQKPLHVEPQQQQRSLYVEQQRQCQQFPISSTASSGNNYSKSVHMPANSSMPPHQDRFYQQQQHSENKLAMSGDLRDMTETNKSYQKYPTHQQQYHRDENKWNPAVKSIQPPLTAPITSSVTEERKLSDVSGQPKMFLPNQMFMPNQCRDGVDNDQTGTGTSGGLDLFNISGGRSRTQSTTSVGSGAQTKGGIPSRSRNNSESKNSFDSSQQQQQQQQPHYNSDSTSIQSTNAMYHKPKLEPTKEENEHTLTGKHNSEQQKQQKQGSERLNNENVNSSDQKPELNSVSASGGVGWFSSWFKIPNKSANLPDDSNKSIRYDEKLKKWVDVNEPEETTEAVLPPATMMTAPPNLGKIDVMSTGSRYARPEIIPTKMSYSAVAPPQIPNNLVQTAPDSTGSMMPPMSMTQPTGTDNLGPPSQSSLAQFHTNQPGATPSYMGNINMMNRPMQQQPPIGAPYFSSQSASNSPSPPLTTSPNNYHYNMPSTSTY